ncbi:AraC family transcriptional regulator [Allosphingosinicella sp.]|uniref:helix-turn-helix transcriptional regulator n=1 Tax=Allosphingosinicella sp. TaxID=2823234 RepID=UPI002F0C272A
MPQDGSLESAWGHPGNLCATLTHYPGAGHYPLHAHDHLQVSFVLAGDFVEELEGREYSARAGGRGHKPAGARHRDSWGKQGVLIFTLRLWDPGEQWEAGWSSGAPPGAVAPLVRIFAQEAAPGRREEAAADLLADTLALDLAGGDPPPWLERARASIHDAPGLLHIAEAASEGGVDPTHLGRMFRRFYGMPPSIYRRRVQLGRAACALGRTQLPLAQVAVEAGFYDQAHLSRVMQTEIGLTPAQARALLKGTDPYNTRSRESLRRLAKL